MVSRSTGGANLTFEGLQGLILIEDVCKKSTGEDSNTLLITKDRGRGSNRGCVGSGGSKPRRRSGQNNIRDMSYWNYKESGNLKSYCPMLMADKGQK